MSDGDLTPLMTSLLWLIWIMTVMIPLLAARRYPFTWFFALLKQVAWLVGIIQSQLWFIMPLWVGLTLAYAYNVWRWRNIWRDAWRYTFKLPKEF